MMSIMKAIVIISFSIIIAEIGSLPIDLQIKESDVDFIFYSASNPSQGIRTNISDPKSVALTNFSLRKDTFFCIHGFILTVNSSSCQKMKNNVLQKHDVNVFIVDWDRVADHWIYPPPFTQVMAVGELLGAKIQNFVNNNGLNLGKTKIVGHSLGAHIAGVAGRVLEGKLESIVGLDPAGPFFHAENANNRLNTSSAQFVQVIHTCGGLDGYFDPLGHADYYPNGGRTQPMCSVLDIVGLCAHLIALDYYDESLLTGNFRAKKCNNYDDYKKGKCDNSEVSFMGTYHIDKHARGTYFLETHSHPPYAKN